MARELIDIQNELGNAYIEQADVQTYYGITPEEKAKGFNALFSVVALERMFFYAVAYCIFAFEKVQDVFKFWVETKVDAAFVANKPWWHATSLAFQKGYNLVLNEKTFQYEYATIDDTARVIKRVAVRETLQGVCKVQLLVATEVNNAIEPLDASDKALFAIYANEKKPSGVLVEVITGSGDVVDFEMTVNFNPLLMNTAGELIFDKSKPVEIAINDFINKLNDTNFGGNLNITHLIDKVQATTGVVDAKVTKFKINGVLQAENWGTYQSTHGWFKVGTLTITYQPQSE